MVCDLLRSCYQGDMVFTDGGPPVPVRWFFAHPDAKVFPGANSFCSRNWDDTKDHNCEIGEQDGPHPWKNGEAPSDLPGLRLCDAVDDFTEGQSSAFLPSRDVTSNGAPLCCNPAPGGISISGQGCVDRCTVYYGKGGLLISGHGVVV